MGEAVDEPGLCDRLHQGAHQGYQLSGKKQAIVPVAKDGQQRQWRGGWPKQFRFQLRRRLIWPHFIHDIFGFGRMMGWSHSADLLDCRCGLP